MWWSTLRNNVIKAAVAEHLDRLGNRIERLETAPRPAADPAQISETLEKLTDINCNLNMRLELAEASIENLEEGTKEIVIAVAEGIERVDRSERRIRATVKRARKELADRGLVDPGLEAEDRELHDLDGERGNDVPVQPVPREVAPAAPAPSSIRGVPLETLRRFRGV